jgi:hypothetical protein
MITLLSISLLGFFLGMRHATDPDHVIAVTTIVNRERNIFHAGLIGVLWGLGHTLTIVLVGSAIILFKLTIPPRVGLSMELSVGFMLILLGAMNLTGAMQRAMDWVALRRMGGAHSHWFFGQRVVHTHEKNGAAMSGEEFSLPGWTVVEDEVPETEPVELGTSALASSEVCSFEESLDGNMEPGTGYQNKLGLFHVLRPLLVGIVHGLAGSAAVALLVLATISRPAWAIGYLLIFGLGTVAGMMLITAAIAIPFAYSMRHFVRLNRGLALASGFLSVGFGIFLCYQIGFVEGLFTGRVNWIPK